MSPIFRFIVDTHPQPSDGVVYLALLGFIVFIIFFIRQLRNKEKRNLFPTLFAIPICTFFLSFVYCSYGILVALDAIPHVPEAQRFQAMASGLSFIVTSLFFPGIFVVIEVILGAVVLIRYFNAKDKTIKSK